MVLLTGPPSCIARVRNMVAPISTRPVWTRRRGPDPVAALRRFRATRGALPNDHRPGPAGPEGASRGPATGDPAPRPPPYSRDAAAGRVGPVKVVTAAGTGRRHHHADRLPVRPPLHGPAGRRPLRRAPAGLRGPAKYRTGVMRTFGPETHAQSGTRCNEQRASS